MSSNGGKKEYVLRLRYNVFVLMLLLCFFLMMLMGIMFSDRLISTEEDEDEEIERLYEISGMSHEISGVIAGLQKSFLSNEQELLKIIKYLSARASLPVLSIHCSFSRGISCFSMLQDRSNIVLSSDNVDLEFMILLSSKEQIMIEQLVIDLQELVEPHYVEDVIELNNVYYYNHMPSMKWNLQIRNDPPSENQYYNDIRHPFLDDLACESRFLGNRNVLSKHVVTLETPFQRVDVYDFINPAYTNPKSYFLSLFDDDSYESRHAELFKPNRVVFLDGVMQSSSRGNEAYHEALVQPAMFAHENPRRVAIIGGGEGATLKETLKHPIEQVIMIDIDEQMCKKSAHVLFPEWNECSNQSCFHHPKADVRYEDALKWFMESTQPNIFDIIIMDALDPQDTVEFADALYKNVQFWQSLYNALDHDGILVAQLEDAWTFFSCL